MPDKHENNPKVHNQNQKENCSQIIQSTVICFKTMLENNY